MTIHTVVESLAAFEAVRAQDPSGERVWWTTSPYLLVHLPQRGETVRSPEAGLPQERFDGLGRSCVDAAQEFCAWLQAQCPWDRSVPFDLVLGMFFLRGFFPLLYKGLLLSQVVQAAGDQPVECVGNPDLPPAAGLTLALDRFDTVYAHLAKRMDNPGVAVVEHHVPKALRQKLQRRATSFTMGRTEKMVSMLTNTPSSFVYKAWKNLTRRGRRLAGSVALVPFARKTFHIFKDCELVEEAFLGILRRGGRVAFMDSMPRPDMSLASGAGPWVAEAGDGLGRIARERMESQGLEWTPALRCAVDLMADRVTLLLARLETNLAGLREGFERITARMKPGDEILSNSLSNPVERLFYCHCKERGTRVNAFDHGVTLGLSGWGVQLCRHASMRVADRGFYHCGRAARAVAPHAPEQERHVVGLPLVTIRPSLRGLKRRVGRRMMGLDPDEHVVMYVPELERNNFVYGPHCDNDLQFLEKTLQTVRVLCRSFPASRVVLKLYPTVRYLDTLDYSELIEEFPNLLVVEHVDFRFVRHAADLILTPSAQSTLGWVAGAGVPFLYLDFTWAPGYVRGLRLPLPGIDGLAAVVIPDRDGVCTSPPRDVAGILMSRRGEGK